MELKEETSLKFFSRLNKEEFGNALEVSIKKGNPNFKPSTLSWLYNYDSSKQFYGVFDSQKFQLILNSLFCKNFYKITGNYSYQNGKVVVDFHVVAILKYQKQFFGFLVFFIFCQVLFLNYIIYKAKVFGELWGINFVFIFMIIYSIYRLKNEKTKLKKKFVSVFEIN